MLICLDQRNSMGCGAVNPDNLQCCEVCGKSLRFGLRLSNLTVAGRYRIIRGISCGLFGAVYQAEATRRLGRLVLLKQTFEAATLRTIQRKFELLKNHSHPNLPQYYELFEAEGSGYLVMEFIIGQSLQEMVARQAIPLAEVQTLAYAQQICEVLGYLHEQNPPIIHGDLKPANLRLSADGKVKLVDLGLMKPNSHLQDQKVRERSALYRDLEQWSGNANPRSDIYSLGATLYFLLTGVEPIPASERLVATSDPLLSPASLNPKLSTSTANALTGAMSLLQQDRFANINLFQQALLQPIPSAPGPEATLAKNALALDHFSTITDADFEQKVLQAKIPVAVNFYAPWSGVCRITNPIIEKLVSEYKDKLLIVLVNTENELLWAERLGVDTVPTMLFFRNGRESYRIVGSQPESSYRALFDKLGTECKKRS